MTSPAPAAGWYPDPGGQPCWRRWDGAAWTEETRGYFRPIADAVGGTLTLHQGGLSAKADDLKLGEDVVARVAWGGLVNRMAGDATAQASDGSWRLDQQGLLHPKISIFGSSGQIGLYEWKHSSGGGALTFADGRALTWAAELADIGVRSRANDQRGRWWLWDAQRQALLGAALEATEITVSILPAAAALPHLGLHTCLAAVLVMRWWDQSAGRDTYRDFD